jgi:hypothetical protein
VREEQIPEPRRQQCAKLVGETAFGFAVLFNIKGVARPGAQTPIAKRFDLSQSCLALRKLGYTFSYLRNLPKEPLGDLMDDSHQQFSRYGIMDTNSKTTPFRERAANLSLPRALFASSVVKFLEANGNDKNAALFACFVFYTIENARELIALTSAACFANVGKLPPGGRRRPLPPSTDGQAHELCALDAVVKRCVPAGCAVLQVIHKLCVSVSINHYYRSGWNEDRFQKCVQDPEEQDGFFATCFGACSRVRDDATGKLGKILIEICDAVAAVCLARAVTAQVVVDSGFDVDALLTTTRTLAAQNLAGRRPAGFRGRAPKAVCSTSFERSR